MRSTRLFLLARGRTLWAFNDTSVIGSKINCDSAVLRVPACMPARPCQRVHSDRACISL